MPEETPQLPVSEQETQIQAPSFMERISAQKKKILIGLGVFVGVLVFAVGLVCAFKLLPKELNISCQKDGDCVLVINKDDCCRCPQVVNIADLKKNKSLIQYSLYKKGEQEFPFPEKCENIDCAPCGLFPPKAVCLNGVCTVIQGEVTPTPDPTADWETYTNSKVGFSFKYPQTLITSECKDGLHLFESISGLKASEFCETPPLGKISLEYSITPFSPGYSQSIDFEIKEEEIILGNTKAIKQTIKKIKEAPGADYAVLVTFSKDDYYFLVSLRDKQYEDTFNLILSTFKFLDEYRCDTYIRGEIEEEHCAVCGDGICGEYEGCTSTYCDENGICTENCGMLFCPKDCKKKENNI